MKKTLFLAACAAVAMFATGCYFCGDPIDESCKGESHAFGNEVVPSGMAFTKPTFLASPDAFIPRYEALTRVTFEGKGNSLEDATADAIKKLRKEVDCDYVMVVNVQVETKEHPHWCWFLSTTNYKVTCSGIPVVLSKLDRVEAPVVKEEAKAESSASASSSMVNITKNDIVTLIKSEIASVNQQNSGMIKLSDIQVQISAKGESSDKAAVIYPVK